MLKSIAIIGSILWITTVFFVYTQLSTNQPSADSIRNWRHTLEILEGLKEQNIDLKNIIEKEREAREEQHKKIISQQILLSRNQNSSISQKGEKQIIEVVKTQNDPLSLQDSELGKRLLDDRIRELFYLIHSQKLEESVKKRLENQAISLMGLSSHLEVSDGVEEVRKSRRLEISKNIWKSIEKLQNPEDCGKARTLICDLDKQCGFGCELHHVTYCAITAFATQRLLILKNDGTSWKYSQKGWESVFEPVSKCSYKQVLAFDQPMTFSEFSDARVLSLGIIDSLVTKPAFLPQSIPSNLAQNMTLVHSDPPAFFIGTFISYLMRFNPATVKQLDEVYNNIPFGNGPIVGLQIRRTDKIGTEAAFHALEEYMEWTEIWFRVEEKKTGKEIKRRIFIASDDPTVVPEAKQKYPKYEVYGSTEIANTAQIANRYTDASLIGVITDIYILSKVDYLVCTFSSQVCRMGYELRQPAGLDDGSKFHSLDDIYYFGGQQPHEVIAIEDHIAENEREIDLKIGDRIGIAGNHWDGYSKGTNRRTSKIGIFPSYKVVNDWRTFDFKALLN